MSKASNTSSVSPAPSAKRELPFDGGWRVKEWKSESPEASAEDTEVSPPPITNHITARTAASPKGRLADLLGTITSVQGLQGLQWRKPVGIGAVVCAAIVATTVLGSPSSWFDSKSSSFTANAETPGSDEALDELALELEDELSVGQGGELKNGYLLHLGSYQSELGAHLMWIGLEADSATLLKGLEPVFQSQGGDGGTVYDVLVGTYWSQETADGHCAWLNDQNVACSVIKG